MLIWTQKHHGMRIWDEKVSLATLVTFLFHTTLTSTNLSSSFIFHESVIFVHMLYLYVYAKKIIETLLILDISSDPKNKRDHQICIIQFLSLSKIFCLILLWLLLFFLIIWYSWLRSTFCMHACMLVSVSLIYILN